MLKKGDAVLVLAILLAAVLLYAGGGRNAAGGCGAGKIAVVSQSGKTIKVIELDSVQGSIRIKLKGKYNDTILAEKGRIRFEEADCPDLTCVNTGWLTHEGDMAVCLPNLVMIRIEGSSSNVDAVAY